MAYIAPTTRTTGTLITAAIWNSDVVANPIALYAGAMSIASQASLDVIYASSATQLGRIAKGAASQFLRMNAGQTAYEFANVASQVTLLKANSGTTTSTAEEDVDTYAMASTLTAKDTLVVYYTLEVVTQNTAGSSRIRNVTDALRLARLTSNPTVPLAGDVIIGRAITRQAQSSATTILSLVQGRNMADLDGSKSESVAVTTAWTGAWTWGFGHSGLVSGGTLRWSYALFKIAGQ